MLAEIVRRCPLSSRLCPSVDLHAVVPSVGFTLPGLAEWQVAWYNGAKRLPYSWDEVVPGADFMQREYLQLFERTTTGTQAHYVRLYYRGQLRVQACVQEWQFAADQQINAGDLVLPSRRRRWVSRILRFRVLTLGQLQLTGAHAWQEHTPLSASLRAQLSDALLHELARQLGRLGKRVDAVMIKDLAALAAPEVATWQARGYHQLPVQPNMVVPISPTWATAADYGEALTAKYRTRWRRARKKLTPLVSRCLTVEEIAQYGERIYALYLALVGDAPFNVVHLKPGYFAGLSAVFGEDFRLRGYFAEGTLVGFCTALRRGDTLDAHFIGYDEAYNRPHQLYLNMLYDLLEAAIETRATTLVFSRTALEIKSSVGAEPQELFCGLRGLHPATNWLIPLLAPWLSPLPAWVARSPFREP